MHRQPGSLALTLPLVVLAGCAGGSQAPLLPAAAPPAANAIPAALGALVGHQGVTESAIGLYQLTIDPAALQATTELLATRGMQANDDLYELSITNFLKRDSFRIRGVTRTADTLEVAYTFAHPFPAPADPTGTPNGSTNRADLGVAGRLLVLADVATASGNTFFTDVVANTALVTNPAGYYQPKGLLTLTATANAFPYQVLVDEAGPDGSRVGRSNGGDPTGNFGTDGWTRSEFGATNDGWTGFGVLHQGQIAAGTFALALSELAAPTSLTIGVLAKYNDPRGGLTSVEKRGNRLPPAAPDATRFAYRMPHGALDVERLTFAGEAGGFLPNTISSSTLRFQLVDWDARATESTFTDLAADPDVTMVAQGESGIPTLAVCIPGVLGDATVVETFAAGDLQDDDTIVGGDPESDSGRPGDALFFSRAITKAAGSGQVNGTYTGLARATDPEPPGLVIPLDGTTLAPLSGNLPLPVSYQAFQVAMSLVSTNEPPEVNGTIGLKLQQPCLPTAATFIIENRDVVVTDPENDTITYTVVATPNVGAPVTVSGITGFPISNAATGPWTNPSVSSVVFQVYANDADHPGTSGTLMPVISAPQPLTGVITIPNPWVNVWGATSAQTYDITAAPNGDIFVCGYFQGNADLDPGAGVDSKTGFGNWDAFVSKFNSNGVYQWGRHWGGSGQDFASTVIVDAAGNSYIGGRFEGASIDFDPTAGTALRSSVGSYDSFTISLDSTGGFRWAATWGGAGADWVFDMALDTSGRPTMVGRTSGTVDYDPGPGVVNLAGPGGDDSYLLRLLPADGSYDTAFVMGNNVADNFHSIAYDAVGGLYLSGAFQLTMDMDPGPGVVNRTSTFAGQTYILKLSAATFAFDWVAHLEVQVPMGLTWYNLTTDPAGDVYFSCSYAFTPTGDVDAGPGTAIVPALVGTHDALLVAYTQSGDFKWFTTINGNDINPNVDGGRDVVANHNTVFWSGQFGDSNVDFDPGPGTFLMSAAGAMDAFVASFESRYGIFQGAGRIGGTTADIAYAVTLAGECDPVLGGVTQGTVDYDPGPGTQSRPGVGSFTAYAVRLNGGTLAF